MTEGQKLNEDEGSLLTMAIPVGIVVLVIVGLFSTIDIKQ
jgi:hypothetical protein